MMSSSSNGALSLTSARLLLAAVAAVYGSNYAVVKVLDEWVACAPAAAVMRFSLALLFIVPVLLHTSRAEPRVLQWPIARDGLQVGVLFALGYAVQAQALEVSPAGLQAFLLSLTVVVCPVCESAFEGTRQPLRVWAAALLAALGVAALEGGDLGGLGAGALGLWQPVLFGLGFYQLERAMSRHCGHAKDANTAGELDAAFWYEPLDAAGPSELQAAAEAAGPLEASAAALALTAWQMVSVLGVACAWLVLDTGSAAEAASRAADALAMGCARPEVAAALLWTGVVTTAGCAFLEATAMASLSSADAMVIFAAEPLWACLFAWAAIGESIGAPALAGGALIVSACLVSAYEGTDEAMASLRKQASALRRRVATRARPSVEATLLGLLGFGPALAEAVEKVEETIGGQPPM